MVVYSCDLARYPATEVKVPDAMRVERVRSHAELEPGVREAITSFWNPVLAEENIRERFEKRASLWLIRSAGALAGYGWTIQARPIAPYYFPLGTGDVQFFDFFVFPGFRGRALQGLLTAYILQTLKAEGATRAFADTHEWNQAQLASFRMTAFRPMGMVRIVTLFGFTFNRWSEMKAEQPKKAAASRSRTPALARPHER
jgi:GNAT superfamily N-acetyltransferase